MYDFYWYPKCSTCRKAKAKLDELGIDYQAIEMAELLSSNGMLIKRPLLVKNGQVQQIGFKESSYEKI